MSRIRDFYNKIKEKPIDNVVMRLFSSWCLTALVLLTLTESDFTQLEMFAGVSLKMFIGIFAAIFVLITVVNIVRKRAYDRRILPVAFGLYALGVLLQSEANFYVGLCVAVLAVIMLVYYYMTGGLDLKNPFTAKKRNFVIITAVVVFAAVCGAAGVLRYVSLYSPNYDFGIFCQMFYNMRESFSPVTTSERDKLLSHFAVHISPIYYLLLPFYFVFPSPVTLQIGQTAVLASAAVPAYLLCRHFKLSDAKAACITAVTLLQPVVMSGTLYDIHENCFLFPLLLWVFWAFERNKYVLLTVFSLLTLCVKEDAAVYLVFFAIYAILGRKRYATGVVMLIVSGAWFAAATHLLDKYGDGVMTGRYENYMVGEGTLFDVVKNVLADPAYVFTQMFRDENGAYGAKLQFLLQLTVPLAFLPFTAKKVSRLLLLLPAVLLNFMTLYPYQYNISFQYAFGSAAFLTYLAVMNLADMKPNMQKIFSCAALVCSVVLFLNLNATQTRRYIQQYNANSKSFSVMREALSEVPEDKSVCASTFLMPHLSKRSVLYEVYYHTPKNGEKLDYIILDARFSYNDEVEKYTALGYKVTRTVKDGDTELLVFMEPAENGTVSGGENDAPNENEKVSEGVG